MKPYKEMAAKELREILRGLRQMIYRFECFNAKDLLEVEIITAELKRRGEK